MEFEKEVGNSPAEVLKYFDKNEDGGLDFEEFQTLCVKLFGLKEVEENGNRVRDIFEILDFNGDGLLKDEEWERCYNDWIRVILNPVSVLLVIDVQNDFIDGTLALRNCGQGEDGAEVVQPINHLIKKGNWKKVIYTQDWHPENHIGFFENLHLRQLHPDSKVSKEKARLFDTVLFLEPKLEQRLWPVHCIMDSWGAQLHKDLYIAPGSEQVRKGQNPDMETYSAFFDNNSINSTELLDILKKNNVTDVYVCGLAYDVCVRATCLDGLKLGYRLVAIENGCRGVDQDDIAKTRKEISENGGLLVNTSEVISLVNDKKRSLIMAQQGASALAKNWLDQELMNNAKK